MLTDLKREAYEANVALPKLGLATLFFGNASALDRSKGIFAIRPAGIRYDDLTPGDMVLLDLAGKKVEGSNTPSADAPTHRRLYLGFKKIAGIVQTQSPRATAFAQAGQAIPCFGTAQAEYFNGSIPVTRKLTAMEIEGAYEWETGSVMIERFLADNLDVLDFPGVLVNRQGPFAWGRSVGSALDAAFSLETAATLAMLTLELGPRTKPLEAELRERHFGRRHSPRTGA